MRSLIRGEPDTVIRCYRPLLLASMLLGYLCATLSLPGIITCMFAGALGASGGSLAQYRTERGLWMLAVLFFALYGGIYALLIFGQIGDVLHNAAPMPIALLVDATIGTFFLTTNIRFLYQVGQFNWSISNEPFDA